VTGKDEEIGAPREEEEELGDLGMAVLEVYDRLGAGDRGKEVRDKAPSQTTPAIPSSSEVATRTAPTATSGDTPADETDTLPETVDPTTIGHETCPICILDFEVGDVLRVLPCEGRHRFHQNCVDPWLLEMSSSCPLCREDFQTLEAMVQDTELASDRRRRRGRPSSGSSMSTSASTSGSRSRSNDRPAGESEDAEATGSYPGPTLETNNSPRDRTTSTTSNSRRRIRPPRLSSRYLRFAQTRRARASAEINPVPSLNNTETNRILGRSGNPQAPNRSNRSASTSGGSSVMSSGHDSEERHISHVDVLF